MSMRWTIKVAKCMESNMQNSKHWILLKDGAHEPQNSPVATPLSEPSFYTKIYRFSPDGIPVNTIAKFVYNIRDGWADFDLNYKIIQNSKKSMEKEVAARVDTVLKETIHG